MKRENFFIIKKSRQINHKEFFIIYFFYAILVTMCIFKVLFVFKEIPQMLQMYWVLLWISSWVFNLGRFLNFLGLMEREEWKISKFQSLLMCKSWKLLNEKFTYQILHWNGKVSEWMIWCSLRAPFVLKFFPQSQQRNGRCIWCTERMWAWTLTDLVNFLSQ